MWLYQVRMKWFTRDAWVSTYQSCQSSNFSFFSPWCQEWKSPIYQRKRKQYFPASSKSFPFRKHQSTKIFISKNFLFLRLSTVRKKVRIYRRSAYLKNCLRIANVALNEAVLLYVSFFGSCRLVRKRTPLLSILDQITESTHVHFPCCGMCLLGKYFIAQRLTVKPTKNGKEEWLQRSCFVGILNSALLVCSSFSQAM